MIPSRRLIMLAILLTTPLLLGGVEDIAPDAIPVLGSINVSGRTLADLALLLNVVLVVVAGVDIMISGSPDEVEIQREISEVLSVGTPNPSKLVLRSKCRLPLTVTVHEDPGELCEADRLPQTITLAPWKEGSVNYSVTPLKRGAANLEAVHLRFPTLLKLWTRHQVR